MELFVIWLITWQVMMCFLCWYYSYKDLYYLAKKRNYELYKEYLELYENFNFAVTTCITERIAHSLSDSNINYIVKNENGKLIIKIGNEEEDMILVDNQEIIANGFQETLQKAYETWYNSNQK